MTITPFLTLQLGARKDALHARQTARRVATLLGYSPHEQACITAGVFVIACQALTRFGGKARLCFQIEKRHLHVFAQESPAATAEPSPTGANRITEWFRDVDPQTLYRLSKPLPAEQTNDLTERDLGWLVSKVEEAVPHALFEEVVKQNQEILALLHELRLCQGVALEKEKKFSDPHAA